MHLEVETGPPIDVRDITDSVATALPQVTHGLCHIFVEHTTAGVIINEAESRLLRDIEDAIAELVDENQAFAHDVHDDNAAAHLRAMLLGESVTVPIREGSLALGRWQSVLLVDADGPRRRDLAVTTVSATQPTGND